jgi:hypothetical protein
MLQRPNPLANRRRQAAANKIFVSRRQKSDDLDSRLSMESKAEMRSRGVASPDIADAFCMAFGIEEAIQRSYMPFDDAGRPEIARKRGWD